MKYEWEKAGSPKSSTRYDPTAAALLSFLVTGGGQVYAGETRRGILFFLGSVVSTVFTLSNLALETKPVICNGPTNFCTQNQSTTAPKSLGFALIGLGFSVAIKIISISDASQTANIKNFYINKKEKESTLENKTSLFSNPGLTPVVINNQNQLIPGLGLSLNF